MPTARPLALFLLFAACATPEPQSDCASQCDGCCRDGVCMFGQTIDACGQGGNTCDVCVGAQICSASGRCVDGISAQGGGSAMGGGAAAAGGGSVATGGGGNTCTPETDAELCAAANHACGPLSMLDRCGASRSITSCGSCGSGQACSNATCICQPETNAAMCQRLGAACGTLSTTDNCGAPRTVSCGSCASPNVCAANTCGCTSETDAQFCARLGHSCGPLTGTDNCGHPRGVQSCGPACMSPNTCSNGQCTCPAESDSQFCARMNATCGPVTGTDTCGQLRNVASCGSCFGNQTCGGGATANQCGCTPKSDADLCASLGYNCGTKSAVDNCGGSRTLSCGTCGGTQTCGGGGHANVCGCTAETDVAFCGRLGKNCGSVTAADSCGVTRTATCGSSCATGTTCGGGGTPNVCGCTAQTDAQLCTQAGYSCGPYSTTDSCGTFRNVSCGSCSGSSVCGANGLNGQCGVPVVPTSAQTGGLAVAIAPMFFDNEIQAIRAVSATELWLASANVVVRVQSGVATPYYLTGLLSYSGTYLWSSSPSDVYLASGSALYHFDGSTWSPVNAGFPMGTQYTAVHGTASDDVFVASSTAMRHFDGMGWSPWTAPAASGIAAISGIARATPYVAIGRTVYRWNGLSYATLPTAGLSMPITRLWVSPSGTVYALGADCTYSDQSVSVYDGISKWTDLYYNSPSFTYCSTSNENLAGTADDNVWFGDMWKGGHAVVPQNTTLLGYLMAPTGPGVGFTANATTVWQRTNGQQIPRFSAGAPPKCTQASTDAAGLTWLSCAGALGRVGSNGFSQTSTTTALKAVYAAPSGSVWLALQSGTIERRSGATTTPYTQYAGSTFTAIHGTSDSNVFVLTTEGGVARFDGSAWTPSMIPAGTNPQMQGIVAVSATSAWAWRSAGVYEYASGTWSSVALPGGVTSVSSMAAGGGGVWLLGSTSSSSTPLLYLRSGSTWTLQRTFTQGGVVLASASSGALTLAGTVLERWVSGTGASTVATIANASAYPQFIAMPAVNEVVFGWDDNVYRYKW